MHLINPYRFGGASGPAFYALTRNPSTHLMTGVLNGSGSITASHTGAIYAIDKDGVYQKFPSDTPVWSGGRCVLTGAAGSDVAAVYGDNGSGTPLDPPPYLVTNRSYSNAQQYSNDLTNGAWTPTNMTVARDQTGLDGTSNTGCRITATANNATLLGHTNTIGSSTHNSRWFLSRITGSGTVELTIDGGATWTTVDPDDGMCIVSQSSLSNPQTGIRLGTSGDSIYVGNAELIASTFTHAIADTGPVFTAGSAVSIDNSYAFFEANHADSPAGCWYVEGLLSSFITTNYRLLFTGAGDKRLFYFSANTARAYDGANLLSLAVTESDFLAPFKYALAYESGGQYQINVNGTWGTAATFAGFGSVTGLRLATATQSTTEKYRELRRYEAADLVAAKAIIDGLMT